ncbi:hypothetical protein FNV62_55135 [Streptomyces sp. RLB3-17]|uniref:hypothetical protein n=1 Tax=Streptomyces sp. RLB3-17 TaxID=2594455 RepID=UPI00116273BA|nr:hypothetical protein [Streptomyces sp. RLB3-17]QDO45853.1 hypothetical protein FNV62_55135 [Streptomyces sp. RLB3-17]
MLVMQAQLVIKIQSHAADANELDALTRNLWEELRSVDVPSVDRPAAAERPEGSRGPCAETMGTLVISGVTSAAAMSAMARTVIAWIRRDCERSAELEHGDSRLTLHGLSRDDLHALSEAWVRDAMNGTGRDPSQDGG